MIDTKIGAFTFESLIEYIKTKKLDSYYTFTLDLANARTNVLLPIAGGVIQVVDETTRDVDAHCYISLSRESNNIRFSLGTRLNSPFTKLFVTNTVQLDNNQAGKKLTFAVSTEFETVFRYDYQLPANISVGANVAATQSGVWSVRLLDGAGNVITSTGGALDVNIKSGIANPLPVSGTFWQATQPISIAAAVTIQHGKTLKTVTGIINADTDIIAAVANKRIKVVAYSLISVSQTVNTITFQSNGAGALWTLILQAITGAISGANLSIPAPSFLFATVAGEKLTLDVSAAVNVTYSVTYFDDDAA